MTTYPFPHDAWWCLNQYQKKKIWIDFFILWGDNYTNINLLVLSQCWEMLNSYLYDYMIKIYLKHNVVKN